MSFSSQIKEKLCKSEYGCMNCAAYELSGALMFGGNIGSDSIKFATENENIAKRITADINTAYGIQVETQVISKVQRIIIDNIYQVENITGGSLIKRAVITSIMTLFCLKRDFKRIIYLSIPLLLKRNLHKNTGTYLRRRNTFK